MDLHDLFITFKTPLSLANKDFLNRAFECAKEAHKNQKRLSGDDYISHPLSVAIILASIGMDVRTVSAALLHDVTDDTKITSKDIRKNFGRDIELLVSGVSTLGNVRLRGSQEEFFLENLRNMFLAMATDIRVVIIKLADRLHNMRTLSYLPQNKQIRIANETMDLYVPIANRLGIGELKGELEDLAFLYIDPKNYDLVKKIDTRHHSEREIYLKRAISEIETYLTSESISHIEITGRAKRLFSLYQKLKKYDMNIHCIYDLIAIRIIVPAVSDCYETLGAIHKKYRPMIGRIKDYISLPKPNGYQSIHTTIFGPEGRTLEIQIRTQKMHDEAEFGIAAHWFYAENKKKSWRDYIFLSKKNEPEQKVMKWVRQLREWQNDLGNDDNEFLESLRIDFFKDRIFAFTPKNDIIDLPENSTCVDFAYAIHSDIGNHMTGAKINQKMVSLDTPIKNGQVVEILTSRDRKGPSDNWLTHAKTPNAKSHIRRYLRKKRLFS